MWWVNDMPCLSNIVPKQAQRPLSMELRPVLRSVNSQFSPGQSEAGNDSFVHPKMGEVSTYERRNSDVFEREFGGLCKVEISAAFAMGLMP